VIRDITIEGNSSSRVTHHGGTRDYLAPELRNQDTMRNSIVADTPQRISAVKKAKFSRKADVYAAGIVFLELVTLKGPKNLYKSWPLIERSQDCPNPLRNCLASSLDEDPAKREPFPNLLLILKEGREEIVAIPESFFFSSKRLSRISTTQYNREQRRRTLDEVEIERVKRESFAGDQRRRTLEANEIQKAMRVSVTHGEEIRKEAKDDIELQRIERRSVARREDKEVQKLGRKLTDQREESSRKSDESEGKEIPRVSNNQREEPGNDGEKVGTVAVEGITRVSKDHQEDMAWVLDE
jgi:serine/threonine protein kinase